MSPAMGIAIVWIAFAVALMLFLAAAYLRDRIRYPLAYESRRQWRRRHARERLTAS